jgi:hypothetical protein
MLVRFETKAFSPILMLGDVAIRLLKIMGRSGAVPGAISGDDVPLALRRLQSGVSTVAKDRTAELSEDGEARTVDIEVRAFPLVELLRHASNHGFDVIWQERSQ